MADQIVQRIAIEGTEDVKKSFADIAASGTSALGQIKQAADNLSGAGGTSISSLAESIKAIGSAAASLGSALTSPFSSMASAGAQAASAASDVGDKLNNVKSSGDSVSSAFRNLASSIGGAGGSFSEFGASITRLGASIGALVGTLELATAGIIAFTVSQAEAAQRAENMSAAYGLSIDRLNALSVAFTQNGYSIYDYRLSFNRLANTMNKAGEVQDENKDKIKKYAEAVHDAIEKAQEYKEKLDDQATKRRERAEDLQTSLSDIERRGLEESIARQEKHAEKLEDIGNARRERERARESSHAKELEAYEDKVNARRKKAAESIEDLIDQRRLKDTKDPEERANLEFAIAKKKIEREQKAEEEAEQKKVAREREKEARDEKAAQEKEQRELARQEKHDAEQEKKEQAKEQREVDRENKRVEREIARDKKTDEREERKEKLRLEKEEQLNSRLLREAEKAQKALDKIAAASTAVAKAKEDTKALGDNMEGTAKKTKDLADGMVELAARYKAIADPQERIALLNEVASRKGPQWARVLETIAEKGIAGLEAEARALQFLDASQTLQMAKLRGSWETLGVAISNTKLQIASVFANVVQGAIERLLTFVNRNRDAFVNLATILTNIVGPAFTVVHWIVLNLATVVIQSVSAIASAIKTLITPISTLLGWLTGTNLSPENLVMVVLLWKIVGGFKAIEQAGLAILASWRLIATAARFAWGNPMLLIIGAVIAAVALLVEHWDKVKWAAEEAAKKLNSIFGTTITGAGLLTTAVSVAATAITAAFVASARAIGLAFLTPPGGIITAIILALAGIVLGIQYLYNNWADVCAKMKAVWKPVDDFITKAIEGWKKALQGWLWMFGQVQAQAGNSSGAPTQDYSNATGGNQEGFASGGLVRGRGGPRSDSILARLSNGEFVQSAAAVQRYGTNFMHRINSLSFPVGNLLSFARGGLVGPSISIPASAGGASTGTKIDLHIGGETFAGLIAPSTVAGKLVEFATTSNVRSLGRKPSWVR